MDEDKLGIELDARLTKLGERLADAEGTVNNAFLSATTR